MATILIIGASQGLGLEWVKHYKAQGHDIIATTRNPDTATELKELLHDDGDKIFQLDVTNADDVQYVIEQLPEAPDITIYNAGVKGYIKSPDIKTTLLNTTLHEEDISSRATGRELAFKVNAFGFDQTMFALKDRLLAKPQATVVYVSTGVAETSQNTGGGYPFYRQSKTAGESFARGWDIDLSERCLLEYRPRVFSIVPGLVDTGMGAGIDGAAPPCLRVAEMAKVIEQVKISGDTHGVWKYDGTKVMVHEIPDSIKRAASHVMSDAELLSKSGFYKTGAAQSSQGGSVLAPTP
ncbi:SDR family NAD(P)-dependent oxidoreductase [Legionella worsleiensis]|uniref:Oxidoreductase n=1 Tax=Legionella worsleiensis TaxID=45076 RepID=A0A0W1AGC5_9GAMM|nr:SDR family NAD(P)-dependent oxidoreductase [Legionella worsleiensis]KTD80370.1 oxidoreductase [Legionella worsleiensis]STY32774.1 oxidoreductase [Legionella worsleiensis]